MDELKSRIGGKSPIVPAPLARNFERGVDFRALRAPGSKMPGSVSNRQEVNFAAP